MLNFNPHYRFKDLNREFNNLLNSLVNDEYDGKLEILKNLESFYTSCVDPTDYNISKFLYGICHDCTICHFGKYYIWNGEELLWNHVFNDGFKCFVRKKFTKFLTKIIKLHNQNFNSLKFCNLRQVIIVENKIKQCAKSGQIYKLLEELLYSCDFFEHITNNFSNLIPTKNGMLINLKTNECRKRVITDYYIYTFNTEHIGSFINKNKHKNLIDYLNDVSINNTNVIEVFQYLLSLVTDVEIAYYLLLQLTLNLFCKNTHKAIIIYGDQNTKKSEFIFLLKTIFEINIPNLFSFHQEMKEFHGKSTIHTLFHIIWGDYYSGTNKKKDVLEHHEELIGGFIGNNYGSHIYDFIPNFEFTSQNINRFIVFPFNSTNESDMNFQKLIKWNFINIFFTLLTDIAYFINSDENYLKNFPVPHKITKANTLLLL